MHKSAFMALFFAAATFAAAVLAEDAQKAIKLPSPQTDGGKPLMQALKDRHSSREFSDKTLPEQVLSNLLWAANGVNRDDGKRTTPSAVNWQEIDIYVALPQGLFVYDAKANALNLVVAEDCRAVTGKQSFVKEAPLNLVYVADYTRIVAPAISESDLAAWTGADTGFISQNVYLFCSSEGLNTVVRGMIDKAAFAKAAKLRPEQHVVLAQTIGYPK